MSLVHLFKGLGVHRANPVPIGVWDHTVGSASSGEHVDALGHCSLGGRLHRPRDNDPLSLGWSDSMSLTDAFDLLFGDDIILRYHRQIVFAHDTWAVLQQGAWCHRLALSEEGVDAP
jgi:hypothetical protein